VEHTAELKGKISAVDRVLILTLLFKAPIPENSAFKLAFSGISGNYNIRLRVKFSLPVSPIANATSVVNREALLLSFKTELKTYALNDWALVGKCL
jgi:hypothetical protein